MVEMDIEIMADRTHYSWQQSCRQANYVMYIMYISVNPQNDTIKSILL